VTATKSVFNIAVGLWPRRRHYRHHVQLHVWGTPSVKWTWCQTVTCGTAEGYF